MNYGRDRRLFANDETSRGSSHESRRASFEQIFRTIWPAADNALIEDRASEMMAMEAQLTHEMETADFTGWDANDIAKYKKDHWERFLTDVLEIEAEVSAHQIASSLGTASLEFGNLRELFAGNPYVLSILRDLTHSKKRNGRNDRPSNGR